MKETVFNIKHIPAILYGEPSNQVYLFVHGKCGYKEEGKNFAQLVCPLGWQVLAIDLPEHGARKGEAGSFDPWHVVPELRAVMVFARQHWSCIALRATSIGAWFSMLAFSEETLERCLLLSPVLNMEQLIQRMMGWAGVTETQLAQQETIQTSFGETLSWRYYQYAKEHPVEHWNVPTAILYAGQDNLPPRQEAEEFAARFQCDLTILENGEHWFHTPKQMEALRKWTEEKTGTEQWVCGIRMIKEV